MRIPFRDELYVLKKYRLKAFPGLIGRPFVMKDESGVFMCPDIGTLDQFDPSKEVQVRRIITSMPNGLFLDVGANIGKYSVISSKLGNEVIAVEPNPRAARFLKYNLASNRCRNYDVVEMAAWKEATVLRFFPNKYAGVGSVVNMVGDDSFDVRADTLDSMLGGRLPRLVKLDVEGAESEAIQGLESTLAHERVPIIFEASDEMRLTKSSELLKRLGYKIARLDDTNYLAGNQMLV